MDENMVAAEVIDVAFDLHRKLGPGLLESVYEVLLAHKLEARKPLVTRQRIVPICYEGITFQEGFRADLVVNELVIVELKSLEQIHPAHGKQLLTYLRLSGLRLGLLINFGEKLLKDGIKRIANRL